MIVATAGHVDHGKTSLVRQLTGVDTDRLAEEKRRGLSINLGYAYLPTDSGMPIGFIDVPGHQRFINTMISGVSGIDLGMLVIAADDGVMPQTREHLDVLSVLGVSQLVLVVTKVDRVAPERVAEVTASAHSLLEVDGLTHLETFPVDNITGHGVAELKEFLMARSAQTAERARSGCFRLSIDRAFNLKGAGLVVTGTAAAGSVAEGDTLMHFPSGEKVRVRTLRVHDQQATQAQAGQRCALNLAGAVGLDDVQRGDFLLAEDCGQASDVIDADVTLLGNAPFPLKHLSPVKLHVGARRVAARIALPATSSGSTGENSGKRLLAGTTALTQLRLDEPVPAYTGQRFVLRDHAENVTLGGGVVIDPNATPRRKTDERTALRLQALLNPDIFAGLAGLVNSCGIAQLSSFCEAWNLSSAESVALRQRFQSEDDVSVLEQGNQILLASSQLLESVRQRLHAQLQQWHTANPRERGLKASVLTQSWSQPEEVPVLTEVLKQELQRATLALNEGYLSIAGFQPAKATEQEKAWAAYSRYLQQRGTHIALLSETSEATKLPVPVLRKAAKAAVREGLAFQVSERRFALPEHLLILSAGVLKLMRADEEISVIALKTEWGLGRTIAIEIVEFFDSVRFTARRGNVRIVLDEALPQKLFATTTR